MLTPSPITHLILTLGNMSERLKFVAVKRPIPIGPAGTRGMGEMSLVPLASELAAARHAAPGAWFDELPQTSAQGLKGSRLKA